jgi:hypothetical protein
MSEYKTYNLTDGDTGEVIESKTVEVKPGRRTGISTSTEESRNANKRHQEDVAEMREEIDDAYFHLIYKYGTVIFKELEEKLSGNKNNIHIIRFVILASYITWHGNLSDSNDHKIKKSSLKKIWDTTSRNSINETYDLLLECGYIYETEAGYIMMNKDMVIKGKMKDYYNELKKQDKRYTYTRVYIDNVRDMYYGTEPKQRKQLANLFKILPYINFKYNVFCSNPTETNKDKVKPLTWTDLARLCGYEEKKHITRFKKDLMSLRIYGYDVIGEFNHGLDKKNIVVNPRVYYGDVDVSNVKGVSALFDI